MWNRKRQGEVRVYLRIREHCSPPSICLSPTSNTSAESDFRIDTV